MHGATVGARPEVGVGPFGDALIRVVIIDGDRVGREQVCASLHREPGFSVAGCDADASGVSLLGSIVGPAVLLINPDLRDDESVHVCANVRDRFPVVRVVAMGMAPPYHQLVALLRAGVAGFIMKEAPLPHIVATIRHVVHGGVALPRAMTPSLFAHVAGAPTDTLLEVVHVDVRLTERELEVIALLGEGLNNKAIALRLHIAIHTVKSHVHNILEKLSLHSRLEVAAYSRTPGRRQ